MKNKKLFAILTLLCFMFTLMPVAAFAQAVTPAPAPAETYAEVDSDYTVVKVGKNNVLLNITNATTGSYYAFALKDGVLVGDFQTVETDGAKKVNSDFISIEKAGKYEVFVTAVTEASAAVVGDPKMLKAEKVSLLKDEAVTMLDNDVVVKDQAQNYRIELTTEKGTSVAANSGYNEIPVVATLYNTQGTEKTDDDTVVVGAALEISTNSSAISVNKTSATTNAAGVVKFKVSASTAGEYKVYVEYGTKADAELVINAGVLAPAKISLYNVSYKQIALGQAVTSAEAMFTITDINGNVINADSVYADKEMFDADQYDVKVIEKPAGSAVDDTDTYGLKYSASAGAWLFTGPTLDEEGTYTFKIMLANGAYTTVTVDAKEFQTPVELKIAYKQNAIELDGEGLLNKLYYVDANGVIKSLFANGKVDSEVKLSANGYAIDKFTAADGTVKVKADEKYVGSKITVLAVSEKYNLVATAELTVANEAAAVKYANTNADVAVNNTLTANIVDMDGNKVALNKTAVDKEINYIVLDKPANAKVAVSTISEELAAKGQFKVSFTASEIGEYKLQTVVRYEQADGEDSVVKYYSGIETITVGNTGVEDVVVMSVGSNAIVVNSEIKTIDAAPIVENNRTFVPFRALAEAFGATVAYDEATQAVTAELNGTTVVMTIGSAAYTVNGVEKTADVAPFINGSRTMVPVRFVAEAFGITVTPTYDDNGATADILFAK